MVEGKNQQSVTQKTVSNIHQPQNFPSKNPPNPEIP
jgi:hypothetical protein